MSMSDEKRKKFWEEDEDEDLQSSTSQASKVETSGTIDSTRLDSFIHECRTLLDQTHQLYIQYFNGVEKRIPLEKSKQLMSRVSELQQMSVNLTSGKFKISQFVSQYNTMRDLWDRKLRELERK